MDTAIALPRYSLGEEIANAVTHGIGLLFAVAALVMLTVYASLHGTAWHIVGCSLFGGTMVLLYAFSTLYHSFPWPRIKRVFQTLDHLAIFLLIAGTYTPFTLGVLRGPWGWSLFGTVWGLAVAGIILKCFSPPHWRTISLTIYLAMGWAIIVAIKPLVASLAPGGLILLVTGGLAYTLGVPFYLLERIPYNHAIWHVFVLAGTVLHFFSILFYVIPA